MGIDNGRFAAAGDILDTGSQTLWQLIQTRADVCPDGNMAIDEHGRTLTYDDYRSWCLRTAAGLADLGVGEGTRVSWILTTRFEALVLAGALARLGSVQNPIIPIYRQREVGFITRQSGCELLLVPGPSPSIDYAAMAREATTDLDLDIVVVDPDLPSGDPERLTPYRPAFDELRWLFYSSGTTADPKGAMHSDKTLSAANDSMQWGMQNTSADKAAVVFPVTHIGGLVWLFNTLQTGVELLMVETFDAKTTPPWLSEQGCTCAGAGTVFWRAYMAAQDELPAGQRLFPDVRIFNGGGAPRPATIYQELFDAFGAPVIASWGLTESPIVSFVHLDDPLDKQEVTEGRACPGVSLRVVLAGVELGHGEEGELQVKAPQVCMGYVDSALDAEAFTDDGWFRTGDLGTLDEGGWVRITGRLKDVIIRKGENISAKEVEDLLHAHAKIIEVAVIGLPDAERGERACAVVVGKPDDPLTFGEMIDYLGTTQLSRHKYPEQLELIDDLPRNPTGKILKRDLRTRFTTGA